MFPLYFEKNNRFSNSNRRSNPRPLKRLVSIALLLVFLFNVGGYYVVFYALRYQADLATRTRLDAGQYSEEETSVIKIPMAIPYPVQEGVYQAMTGKFAHDGLFYKGIKQKIENDTLFIVCVRDADTKHIDDVMKNYQKVANDESSKSKQGQSILSKLLKEYETFNTFHVEQQGGWAQALSYISSSSTDLPNAEHGVQPPPPWRLS